LKDSFVEPWKAFHIRWGLKGAVGILGFVIFYKWGVYLVSGMSTPFLIQSGYTVGEVGAVVGGAGLGASILGTMAGAAAMSRLTLERALWLFGITQAVCGLQFWHLAHTDPSMTWMMSAVVSEYFFIGMGSVALVAFMTRVCDVRFSATQFAVLSSAMAASRDLLTSPSGIVAESLGWPNFFLFALVASVPGLLLLPLALKAVREDAA
jgi:PAT family beta-lactamase induction signal transducer AmpG